MVSLEDEHAGEEEISHNVGVRCGQTARLPCGYSVVAYVERGGQGFKP